MNDPMDNRPVQEVINGMSIGDLFKHINTGVEWVVVSVYTSGYVTMRSQTGGGIQIHSDDVVGSYEKIGSADCNKKLTEWGVKDGETN